MKKHHSKPKVRQCDLEACIYNDFEIAASLHTPYLPYKCPGCLKKVYHSEICAFNDNKHLSICRHSISASLKSQSIVRNNYGIDQAIYLNSEELEMTDNVLGIGGFATVKNFKFSKI